MYGERKRNGEWGNFGRRGRGSKAGRMKEAKR